MAKQLYGLFGRSLKHSLSRIMHQTAFEHLGIAAGYELIELDPDEFDQRIKAIKEMAYAGFNITIPYKKAIIQHLDEISAEARAIGAVNTIKISGNKWTGYNTDVSGFIQPLSVLDRKFRSVMVLGNGGAALAVIYAIQRFINPERTIICARNEQRTWEIIQKYKNQKILAASFYQALRWLPESDLVINTTPLGMSPDTESTPLPDVKDLRDNAVVYDLVYNPQETRLLRDVQEKHPGATLIRGLPMLVGQAAEAFKIWTGREFPLKMVYDKLKGEI